MGSTVLGLAIAAVMAVEARADGPTPGAMRAAGGTRLVDPFESAAAWKPMPADGVEMTLSSDSGAVGRSLRIDFRFVKGGGYAVLHRDLDLDLPENYRFLFRVRGACPTENLELKLVDSSGANVWWCNRRDYVFPRAWQTVSTRKRQIPFAWGPAGGGELHHVAAIEFAITAGSGGQGTVWLDQLELEPLPPADATPPRPVASASSAQRGHAAARAVDADTVSAWRSAAGDRWPALTLDLGVTREFSALLVDWAAGERLRDYAVETSQDGKAWSAVRDVRNGGRARDWLYLPEREGRWLRLRATAPVAKPCGIAGITVQPVDWAPNENAFFEHIARASRRGLYPRGMSGEQALWTVIGSDARDPALMSADGAIEPGRRQFTLEPFLFVDGRLVTWADVHTEQSLVEGELPFPEVRWTADSLELKIAPFVTIGHAESFVSLSLRNLGSRPRRGSVSLAVRPFQVNPPSQFLNTTGGVADIRSLTPGIRVNEERSIYAYGASTRPEFGATTFDAGDIAALLERRMLPAARSVWDSTGRASGALDWPFDLAPRRSSPGPREVPGWSALVGLELGGSVHRVDSDPASNNLRETVEATLEAWRQRLGPVRITLPDTAVAHSVRAQIGWMLASRDSAALRPGTRSYARSWIRDGAMMSSALLRMGRADVVREYIEWYAPYLYDDGKVPCCVDARGSDPVPEHDSHGEFIYLVAEYLRFTGDTALARRMWPRVRAAAAYLDTLRAQRRTAEWRTADRRPFFGILPPSISHEGYSAKPMHSYWDDLFALRGYKDAVELAAHLGRTADQKRIAASRDEFARDLAASVRAAMAAHAIDYVPGCADLGDFDATSTTIAFDPVQADSLLGRPVLVRTFQRYWEFFEDRRTGRKDWEAYTPYEMRTIGAFVRLGWRERADSLLQWFMDGQRPKGWRQWPEVVWKDARTPHFLGDLPHAWVASDFVRSVLDMLAYERESDGALVVGAGIPLRWVQEGEGVSLKGLRTTRGELSYSMKAAAGGIDVRLDPGLTLGPAGAILAAPGVTGAWHAQIDGRDARLSPDGTLRLPRSPATVRLTPP